MFLASPNGALALTTHALSPAVPTTQCSGRGYFVPDVAKCECNDCYTGPACENRSAVCVLPLLSVGQPYLLQQFWQSLPGNGTTAPAGSVRIDPGFRCAYQYPAIFPPENFPLPPPYNIGYDLWLQLPGIGPTLDATIRAMHKHVGNVETDGRYIVVGTGASTLFQAAIYAYSKLRRAPQKVVARAPRYDMYSSYYVVTHNPSVAQWNASTQPTDANVVELLTHPNNPDGRPRLRGPLVPNASQIHDLVYYWCATFAVVCLLAVHSLRTALQAAPVRWRVCGRPRRGPRVDGEVGRRHGRLLAHQDDRPRGLALRLGAREGPRG
jgi:hypothetical protein